MTSDPSPSSLQTPTKGRCLKRLLISFGILIVGYSSWIAYDVHRPLNESESKLVGEWVPNEVGTTSPVIQFKTNRTYAVLVDFRGVGGAMEQTTIQTGTWSVQGPRLKMRMNHKPFQSIIGFKRTIEQYLYTQDLIIETLNESELNTNYEDYHRKPSE